MSKRGQLITAAKELLWERGYEAMSPRAVQERSGAGQGSFYHHFAGKADLARTALAEVADEMRASFDGVMRADRPPLERVRDYLKQPRAVLRGCRMGRMTQEEVLSQDMLRAPVADYFAYIQRELASALAQAQRDNTLDETIDAGDLATTLVAVVQGGYVLARAQQDPEAMDRAISGALSLLAIAERQ